MESTRGAGMVISSAASLANTDEIDQDGDILQSPLKHCSIALSELFKKDNRLEASVFDIEAKQALATIYNCKFPPINLIGDKSPVQNAYYGGRVKRRYVPPHHHNAIGFIGSSEMLDCYPKPVKFMMNSDNIKDFQVKQGQLLISRSGTIGNLTYVNKTLEKILVSEDAIRLDCKDFPGYVYSYLKSKIGQILIHSLIYGAVITHIEPEHSATLPIPNPPSIIKKEISNLIIKSYELRDESNALLDQATTLLVKSLQFPSVNNFNLTIHNKTTGINSFNVKLSEMFGRADASYHIPISTAIIDHMKNFTEELVTIEDPRISKEVILPGRFKRVYVEEEYGRVFIGGKQLYELHPSNKKYLALKYHADRIRKQLELHENMILITCSGTIGKVLLVGKHWEHYTANQHIIRIIPANQEIAGYLSIFLSSDYALPLIKRNTYGSVIDEIDDDQIRKIPIPLLKDKLLQETINKLALQANVKRYEAYKFEEEALQIIDKDVINAQ